MENKKRALISVSDKTDIEYFAKELVKLGFEIISTGGTRKFLEQQQIDVIPIKDIINFDEILESRVKTLHPRIHGAILACRNNETHMQDLLANSIIPIDLVCVNLYPFKKTIENKNISFSEVIEQIDIGGPSMIRSAAKNHKFVTIICESSDFSKIIEEFKLNGDISLDTRQQLAAKAFRHTAKYDSYIANYLTDKFSTPSPESVTLSYDLKQDLRYGENSHQSAKFYTNDNNIKNSVSNINVLQGKELSYNNIQDANAALDIINEFPDKTCLAAIKHMNPCAVAISDTVEKAWDAAYSSDKTSIFGGVVATNGTIDKETSIKMSNIFLEIILAKSFNSDALEILSKKKNLRLIEIKDGHINSHKQITSVKGGVLIQNYDTINTQNINLSLVTGDEISESEKEELIFAQNVVKHVKSNAIVVSQGLQTVGIGIGQTSRIKSAQIALGQCRDKGVKSNLTLASDAFFPFGDIVELAKDYGVTKIVQPGGSVRDQESIDKAIQYGIKMLFTYFRSFKH